MLLAALERRIKGRHSIGWLIADLMFKLGLLGTVIGFILLLSAVTDIRSKLSLTPNGSMIIF